LCAESGVAFRRDILAQVQSTDRAFPDRSQIIPRNASASFPVASSGVRHPHSRATAGDSPVRQSPSGCTPLPSCGKQSVLGLTIGPIALLDPENRELPVVKVRMSNEQVMQSGRHSQSLQPTPVAASVVSGSYNKN